MYVWCNRKVSSREWIKGLRLSGINSTLFLYATARIETDNNCKKN